MGTSQIDPYKDFRQFLFDTHTNRLKDLDNVEKRIVSVEANIDIIV